MKISNSLKISTLALLPIVFSLQMQAATITFDSTNLAGYDRNTVLGGGQTFTDFAGITGLDLTLSATKVGGFSANPSFSNDRISIGTPSGTTTTQVIDFSFTTDGEEVVTSFSITDGGYTAQFVTAEDFIIATNDAGISFNGTAAPGVFFDHNGTDTVSMNGSFTGGSSERTYSIESVGGSALNPISNVSATYQVLGSVGFNNFHQFSVSIETATIPEASTYSAIFGVLVIGYSLYRRNERKS